jgi:lipid II:glycine glycyltransferase (peptidoglycan interpeptide bridge formation enzyme)
MIIWREFQGDKDEWNKITYDLNISSYAQMYNWGEVKDNSHLKVQRIIGIDNLNVVCAAQVFYKKFPLSFIFVWIPGGPLGPLKYFDNHFIKFLKIKNKVKFIFCKSDFYRLKLEKDINVLKLNNWSKSVFKLNSGLSLNYNPSIEINKRLNEASKNWKRNLKRSIKKSPEPYQVNNLKEFELKEIYNELNNYKGIKANVDFTQMKLIISKFSENIILYRCDNLEGKIISFRGSLYFKNLGWDIFAATSIEGRKLYSSYYVFWDLMKSCSNKNINRYDMGGINPKKNPGVYNFKKGSGAELVSFIGEWDYSSHFILRYICNLILKFQK